MRCKCSNCSNELKEDSKFCPKCGYCVIDNICSISLCADNKGAYKPLRMAYINPKVTNLANKIIKEIPQLKIKHKTEAYTTLTYDDGDVCRIEFVNGGLRLRLSPTKEDREKYLEHPFFMIENNKKISFWKCMYKEDALDFYISIIKNTMKMYDDFNNKKS